MNSFRQFCRFAAVVILGTLACRGIARAAGRGVNGSPHDLLTSAVASDPLDRVCVFCHTPHNARPVDGPLWSRPLSGAIYQTYHSPTLKAAASTDTPLGQPTGASRLCLSCHDGTIALGSYTGSNGAGLPLPPGAANLGTDLSDDHPISFAYAASVAGGAELAPAGPLNARVKLDAAGMVQCTSCHDPHDNEFGNFLVMNNSNAGSPLCVACHQPAGWPSSVHNPAVTADPSLSAACLACHEVHSAPGPSQLLKYATEDELCYSCHGGSVSPPPPNVHALSAVAATARSAVVQSPTSVVSAAVNVKPLFGPSLYRHPVELFRGSGGKKDQLTAKQTRVTCSDCHNSHQVMGAGSSLPAGGALAGAVKGVRGISKDTHSAVVATAEYEICYKCHSGPYAGNFSGITESRPNRMIAEPDQMRRFDGMNPSFHPVTADRRTGGTSLLPQYQKEMVRISCTDCHNSDESKAAGGTGANGPHGSRYEHILIARYDMPPPATGQPYSTASYSLCFRCHSETYVMESGSGFVNKGVNEHAKHVISRGIPCFACHDPHGAPRARGATTANNAHLINFDRSYTSGVSVPIPLYVTNWQATGSCTVSCHKSGVTHAYAP